MTRRRLARLALLLPPLAGCGREPPPEPIEPPPAHYSCADGSSLSTVYLPDVDRLRLKIGTAAFELDHQPAAGGAKFANDVVSFWSRGPEATLSAAGRSTVCKVEG